MLALAFGIFVVALLVVEVVYELRTGKLLGRSWKVYLRREDNPMPYWSSVTLEILMGLFVAAMVVAAAFAVGLRN